MLHHFHVRIMLLFIVNWCFFSSVYASGVQVNKTRIVFNEGEVKSSVIVSHVANASDEVLSSKSFVIETSVYDTLLQDDLSEKLYSIPNVFTLKDSQSTIVNIIPIGNDIKSEVELLYYLGVSVYSLEEDGGVSRSFYKILFRQASLKNKPANNDSLLVFNKQKNVLHIRNPTPYFVAIGNFYVDGEAINEPITLPPLSEMKLPIDQSENIQIIKWNAIDDYGGVTPFYHFYFH